MMRRGVRMPEVQHVVRRARVKNQPQQEAEAKSSGESKPGWPDRGGVSWAFQDARRVR